MLSLLVLLVQASIGWGLLVGLVPWLKNALEGVGGVVAVNLMGTDASGGCILANLLEYRCA